MCLLDTEDFRFLGVNPAATQLYGYSEAEFLSLTLLDLVSPERSRRSGIGWFSLGRSPTMHPACQKDGGILHVEMTEVTLQL